MTRTLTPPATASRARDAAVAVATETLLNCYLREGGAWRALPAAEAPHLAHDGDTHVAVLPLHSVTLYAGVRYLSATHRHRFRTPVTIAEDGRRPATLGFAKLARMLVAALGDGSAAGAVLARIDASAETVASFLSARDGEVEALWSAAPLRFADSEAALLLGHLLHPTPKSRCEMSARQIAAYSPELAARFQLHWLSVDARAVEHDSATGTPATELAARLLGGERAARGRVLVPAHPWQLEHLREHDPAVAALLRAGTIEDLGPLGDEVAATTSLRTVHNPDWAYQLKFSLHVRVTNSLRVTLPKELRRGVEAALLLQTEVGERAARIAPRFTMLQDPAHLAILHDGRIVDGLSVILRENRWQTGSAADVSALATLCQDHPYGGRSRLGQIVAAIAEGSACTEEAVARAWFGRYCAVVIVPLVRLYLELGLCMEPHAQNVLLELEGGWPARGVYRDSQGYFHREAAHADLSAIVPGIGERSESIFPEKLADERLVYYPFLNNALGVINALGVAGCCDERLLLGDLRVLLERERERGGRYPATLLHRLLDDERWPCKANLRTRIGDLDELAGAIESQSVYVTIPNPLRAGARWKALEFRAMDRERDLELVHGWMQQPHVAPWWELAGPLSLLREHLAAHPHVDCWIAGDGEPFAYVETYRVCDDPLAAHVADAGPGDRGFHVLIGPPERLGQGLGRLLVREVTARLLAEPGATRVVCEPDARNERMLGCCRSLGGERLETLDLDGRRAVLLGWTRVPAEVAA